MYATRTMIAGFLLLLNIILVSGCANNEGKHVTQPENTQDDRDAGLPIVRSQK